MIRRLFDTATHRSFCIEGRRHFPPRRFLAEAMAVIALEDGALPCDDPGLAAIRAKDLAAGEPWFPARTRVYRSEGVPDDEASAQGDPGARYLRALRSDLHKQTGSLECAPYRLPDEAFREEFLALARLGHHPPQHWIGQSVLMGAGEWVEIVGREEAARFFGGAAALGNDCALRDRRESPWREEVLAVLSHDAREEIAERLARLRPGHDQPEDFITSWRGRAAARVPPLRRRSPPALPRAAGAARRGSERARPGGRMGGSPP